MKRIILAFILSLACISGFAQTYRFRSSDYAFGRRNSYGTIVWGNWERSRVLITINADEGFIKVYSQREQNYVIVDSSEEYNDDKGGRDIDYTAIDEEGIECTIRLRIQADGATQFYAFYNNVAWVYSGLQRI